jgi:CheY-like chemotaxis protein
MVKGIIESYGGDIQVKSEPGKKTAFTIRLPSLKSGKKKAVEKIEPLPSGTERILFVDDEPPIARLGSRMLEGVGYKVTTMTNSLEALELFREKPDEFDLVITDMTMPSMTGDILATEMRQIRPDLPIILCTGYNRKISDQKTTHIKINALAHKPFTKADITRTIREVLDAKR